jgi:REP element-mobilizing transposase RayT
MSSVPLAKYRYRRRLPHLQKADCDLFITFCTGTLAPLPAAARDLILGHCLREHGARIRLYAVVVMPYHVHLLLSPRRDSEGWPFPLVDILQCMKSATSHRINKLLHLSGPVWSDESLKEKCEYVRQNPARRGLVQRPEQYRWLWVDPEFM